jgi:hypothetical protein
VCLVAVVGACLLSLVLVGDASMNACLNVLPVVVQEESLLYMLLFSLPQKGFIGSARNIFWVSDRLADTKCTIQK